VKDPFGDDDDPDTTSKLVADFGDFPVVDNKNPGDEGGEPTFPNDLLKFTKPLNEPSDFPVDGNPGDDGVVDGVVRSGDNDGFSFFFPKKSSAAGFRFSGLVPGSVDPLARFTVDVWVVEAGGEGTGAGV